MGMPLGQLSQEGDCITCEQLGMQKAMRQLRRQCGLFWFVLNALHTKTKQHVRQNQFALAKPKRDMSLAN